MAAGPTVPSPAEPGGAEGETTALPVAIAVPGRHAHEVRRYVEGILGWQPVDEDTATVVPPAVRLVSSRTEDAATAASGPRGPAAAVPAVLLLTEDDDAVVAAAAGARLRPAASVRWPADRQRLTTVVSELLRRGGDRRPVVDVVRVAGAAGGVGASTVALALAGLAAWHHRRVLVVVGPGAPMGEVRRVPADALGAPGLLRRATPVPGVAGAVALRVDGPVAGIDRAATGADLVVVDAGRDAEADVLVCRPDRAALERLPATTAGTVVVNGEGPVSGRALAPAAGGRRRVWLPTSTRVARAGLHGRVPGSLPGTWLRRLLPVVPAPCGPAGGRTTPSGRA